MQKLQTDQFLTEVKKTYDLQEQLFIANEILKNVMIETNRAKDEPILMQLLDEISDGLSFKKIKENKNG